MKKILLSLAVIIGFSAYAFFIRFRSDDQVNVVTPTTDNTTILPNIQSSSAPTVARYQDGSYTGSVADAYYGNIQVKAIIKNGKITDVQFLQYPNDRGTSIQINRDAMPLLKTEAITAQSANVDIVSGATQSSEGFRVTLKSALDQAS